jgi:hypothetical protein
MHGRAESVVRCSCSTYCSFQKKKKEKKKKEKKRKKEEQKEAVSLLTTKGKDD